MNAKANRQEQVTRKLSPATEQRREQQAERDDGDGRRDQHRPPAAPVRDERRERNRGREEQHADHLQQQELPPRIA